MAGETPYRQTVAQFQSPALGGDDSGVGYLSPTEAAPIFQRAKRASVAQQLIRQVPLGLTGTAYPVFGQAEAAWVSPKELGRKRASDVSKSVLRMQAQKVATIIILSDEIVRLDPAGFVAYVKNEASTALARAFDSAVIFGTGTPFDHYLTEGTKTFSLGAASPVVSGGVTSGGIREDFLGGMRQLVADGRRLTGWVADDSLEVELLSATDTTGQPLWREREVAVSEDEALGAARRGTLLSRPLYLQERIASGNNVGVGGDWSQTAYGVVGGIRFAVSTEATVTLPDGTTTVNLWQQNAIGVLCEAEYGFVMADVEDFVTITV